MLARIHSAAIIGVDAYPVEIEVDITRGEEAYLIVGLPDAAVRESRERVRSAIHNSGFRYPLDRCTVNLAPADIRKEGPSFDLPIAIAFLILGAISSALLTANPFAPKASANFTVSIGPKSTPLWRPYFISCWNFTMS